MIFMANKHPVSFPVLLTKGRELVPFNPKVLIVKDTSTGECRFVGEPGLSDERPYAVEVFRKKAFVEYVDYTASFTSRADRLFWIRRHLTSTTLKWRCFYAPTGDTEDPELRD